MTDPCDLLLVAAFPPELAPLGSSLPSGVRALARTVGVGLVDAAVGTTSLLRDLQPRAVVFLGSCGAYAAPGAPRIGDVVIARHVKLVEPAVVEGRAALPGIVPTCIAASERLHAGLAVGTAISVDVATTPAITVDDALALAIARASGCVAEHLEAFAVASACAARGVSFGAVLGVANVVGSRARDEWLRHHHDAARAAATHVLAWMQAGAPGAS